MIEYCLFGFVIILLIAHCAFKYNRRARLIRKIPGPKDDFFFGNALALLVSPKELFQLGCKYTSQFKDRYAWYAFTIDVVNIYNPKDIEIITSTSKHSAKGMTYVILEPWLKDGLLLSKDSKWLHRRKILTPAFHFNVLQSFFVTIDENSNRLVNILHKTTGEPIDLVPTISEYTLNSICETSMGTHLKDDSYSEGKAYKNAVYELGKLSIARFSNIILLFDFLYKLSSIGRKSVKYLNIVHSFTKNVIRNRKKMLEGVSDISMINKKKRTAMLDLLIAAQREHLIDEAGIQEEVDTFMFEGHDTTAAGLVYCLMLLANHKDIQDKIFEELNEIFNETDRPATIEDLSKMRYLERCIKESLRLYPPVPFISRTITEDVKLGDYIVPAGTQCNIMIYQLHRREDLYKNPLKFDPDRFLPENSVGRHPYAYIPFSAGPRNCIGQKFAIMEMKSCLAAILRNFELQPVTKPSEIEFIADLILRNSEPVSVKFLPRNTKK